MLDFYRTVGGRKFVDGTVPELVVQIKRVADGLETLIEVIKQANALAAANAKKEVG